MKDTRFISFYSYKGGVGRSLALSNLAWLLALEGRRVLIIDMDLEAPGQHQTDLFTMEKPGEGILELLNHFQRVYEEKQDSFAFPWEEVKDTYLRRSPKNDELIEKKESENFSEEDDEMIGQKESPAKGGVWLMPAGVLNQNYYDILAGWNWEDFYEKSLGASFFDLLKEVFKKEGFDDVLVDSRTGLSDVFYVSTLSMSDTVVVLTSFNKQNLEGTNRAYQFLSSEQVEKEYGERKIHLALSPIPDISAEEIAKRREEITAKYPHFKEFDATLPFVPELILRETILTYQNQLSKLSNKAGFYVKEIEKLKHVLEAKKS